MKCNMVRFMFLFTFDSPYRSQGIALLMSHMEMSMYREPLNRHRQHPSAKTIVMDRKQVFVELEGVTENMQPLNLHWAALFVCRAHIQCGQLGKQYIFYAQRSDSNHPRISLRKAWIGALRNNRIQTLDSCVKCASTLYMAIIAGHVYRR